MPFQEVIIHLLHCPHDVNMHLLFCFDLDPVPKFMFNMDFLYQASLLFSFDLDLYLTCSQCRV